MLVCWGVLVNKQIMSIHSQNSREQQIMHRKVNYISKLQKTYKQYDASSAFGIQSQ
jgi:hypothetical protein